MCGISGIFDQFQASRIDEALLTRMSSALEHRGPDGSGHHVEPGVGLAHRRLAIIDVEGGAQPLYNEDGSVVVVYNGEIYNFVELMSELTAAGHVFKTRCDTEVIVHAWEEWGEACLSRFRGMFAIALWDRRQQLLFLARDRLGIKPLHYAMLADGRLLFGSEIKSLLVCPELSRELDPCAVEEFFAFGYVADPRSIFAAVKKVPAGHYVLARRGQRELSAPVEYWDIHFDEVHSGSPEAIAAELRERLMEAVRIRLIAEVPLGAFLSGGVDSSAVVAMMAQISEHPVNTCAIGSTDPRFDERAFAQRTAVRYGTHHHEKVVSPDDFELIDLLGPMYDEPFADSSAMPTYRVCELARQQVTVCLSGDGGDESFAGYRRHRWHLYEERGRALLPLWARSPLFGLAARLYPKADWAPRILRARSTFQALSKDSTEGYFESVAILPDQLRHSLLSDQLKCDLQGYRAVDVLRRHADRAPAHPLSRARYLDLKTYLAGDILTKVDRASMAHSLEVRVPILDHKLLEWVGGIPPRMLLQGGEGKAIFKQAMHRDLDAEILYRRKQGFSIPLAAWLRGPLRSKARRLVLSSAMLDSRLFERSKLRWILDQHESGMRDFSPVIWSLLMFASFQARIG
ncbi:exosortase 1 system-associated amidotransferase 1 [Thiorhodococcus drewsii AZ1]|uniref:asparagine synthase (glutamine-hydrolyzing) n=1 Tax=Thiorhodococcus drewsii AZ1 TaxID=765913 RepID=G2E608_9GAMM|nr:XrtA/PEP-CTERM system amidotransferase [Thiorhodococcus drewsii]EGV28493.1 exosortase 1 system-associated amidotransferase 1 [Thiorhodococcus drewsii AZ1]